MSVFQPACFSSEFSITRTKANNSFEICGNSAKALEKDLNSGLSRMRAIFAALFAGLFCPINSLVMAKMFSKLSRSASAVNAFSGVKAGVCGIVSAKVVTRGCWSLLVVCGNAFGSLPACSISVGCAVGRGGEGGDAEFKGYGWLLDVDARDRNCTAGAGAPGERGHAPVTVGRCSEIAEGRVVTRGTGWGGCVYGGSFPPCTGGDLDGDGCTALGLPSCV